MAPIYPNSFTLLDHLADEPHNRKDDYLPLTVDELWNKFLCLHGEEIKQLHPIVDFQGRIFNGSGNSAANWPALLNDTKTASAKFRSTHAAVTTGRFRDLVQTALKVNCSAPTDDQWSKFIVAFPELLKTIDTLKGDAKAPSQDNKLVEVLTEFQNKECFTQWAKVFSSYCTEADEAARVRALLENEFLREEELFFTRCIDGCDETKALKKIEEEGYHGIWFAKERLVNKGNKNWLEERIMSYNKYLVAKYSHATLDAFMVGSKLNHLGDERPYVGRGNNYVEYGSRVQEILKWLGSWRPAVEPYVRATIIQMGLTREGSAYDKEALYTTGKLAKVPEFHNRVEMTLTLAGMIKDNLSSIRNKFGELPSLLDDLVPALANLYGNLCAGEHEEARLNQKEFEQALNALQSRADDLINGSLNLEELHHISRAGRHHWDQNGNYDNQIAKQKELARQRPNDRFIYGLSLLDINHTDNLRVGCELRGDGVCPVPVGLTASRAPNAMAVDWLRLPTVPDARDHSSLMVETGVTHYHDKSRGSTPGTWHTDDNWHWTRDVPVRFSWRYPQPPKVIAWLRMMDMETRPDRDGTQPCRVRVHAVDVTTEGFKMRYSTEGDTHWWVVEAGWMAVPQGRLGVDVDTGVETFSKKKYASASAPTTVHFAEGFRRGLRKPPQVACLLTRLTMSNRSNYRINACAERVTKEGMVLRGHCWGDTDMWQADVTWVAVPGTL